jgi:hypothetical protein
MISERASGVSRHDDDVGRGSGRARGLAEPSLVGERASPQLVHAVEIQSNGVDANVGDRRMPESSELAMWT